MGLSIANTMSPFMGRGAPMTVIKGGFALGLTRKANDVYTLLFAPSIGLAGLATSSAGFSYKVTGRGAGLGDYVSPQGLTDISAPASVGAGADYNGFVRLCSAPSTEYYGGSSSDGMLAAEESAHSARPELGTVVAPDVRIVIYGKLDSLSVDRIAAGGVSGSAIVTGIWSSRYGYRWPNGVHNGWYASEVHVFDNPQLRGHVTTGSARLFWDC